MLYEKSEFFYKKLNILFWTELNHAAECLSFKWRFSINNNKADLNGTDLWRWLTSLSSGDKFVCFLLLFIFSDELSFICSFWLIRDKNKLILIITEVLKGRFLSNKKLHRNMFSVWLHWKAIHSLYSLLNMCGKISIKLTTTL